MIKRSHLLLSIFALFLSTLSLAKDLKSLNKSELKVGDIVLQELDCHACTLIEEEERSKYSHIAIISKIEGDKIEIFEAYGSVRLIGLEGFLKKSQKDTPLKIMRSTQNLDIARFQMRIKKKFLGLSYDKEFLWDNKDDKGEKLYCSELVQKLLKDLVPVPKGKKMHYVVNRKEWIKYFDGKPIPDGLWGISPGDIERAKEFKTLGYLW